MFVHPHEIGQMQARINWLEGECQRLQNNISDKDDDLAKMRVRYDRLKSSLGVKGAKCCR